MTKIENKLDLQSKYSYLLGDKVPLVRGGVVDFYTDRLQIAVSHLNALVIHRLFFVQD